jgi:hypothetical protein
MAQVEFSSQDFLLYYESAGLRRLHKFVLDVETFRLKQKNVSYETRIRLITNLPQPKKLNLLTFMRINSRYGTLLSIFGSKFGYRILGPILRKFGSTHFSLARVLDSTSPVAILCFSGGFYSGIENFLGKYSSSRRIPFFLIVDNWDNLSSKSVLWNKPSLMGVWGPDMAIDASELHGIDSSHIVYLGSSRLELNSPSAVIEESKKVSPYILFAGTGIQHLDEIAALLETRKILNSLGRSDLSIIYRPHPWNLRGDFKNVITEVAEVPGITIDRDIVEKGSGSFYDQASLLHLENLVRECEFLVAGHSTVIVEALFHGKKVLALTGSTHPLFKTSDSWVIYRHMTKLRGNPGIFECNVITDISKALLELLHTSVPAENLVPRLLPSFTSNYSTRVINALNGMIEESKRGAVRFN